MLDLAKVEAGKAEIKPSRFTVDELFGALARRAEAAADQHAVELVFEIAEGPAAALHRRRRKSRRSCAT